MRRRLPSPALVIASIALFLALGGAGFAASLALVKAPGAVNFVPASVSAHGKVTGRWVTGARVSEGVYTLTIRGDTFAPNAAITPIQSIVSPQVLTISGAGFSRKVAPTCETASKAIASNGAARVEVDCFTFDPASGWQPTDAAFDIQVIGPGR